MSFRTWMYVFAAIGLTLGASGQAQEQNAEPDQPTADQATQAIELPNPLPVIVVESDEASKAREAEERISRQNEEDDLVAQQGMNAATQSMNDSTREMAFYSLLSTVFVGIGTALLIWTLVLTRSANRSAQEAVAVTREIGRDQTRAYVEVDAVKFYWGNPRGEHPEFKISLKNCGNSPSKWFQVRQNYLLYKHGSPGFPPDSFEGLNLVAEFGQKWNGIGPNESGQTAAGPPIQRWEEMAKCRWDEPRIDYTPPENTHGVVVFGEVRYCTVFDEIYNSQFFFGLASLEEYEAEEPVVVDSVESGSRTRVVRVIKEIPQRLSRLPITLSLYKKQDE